jgi:hypothetical protein
MSIVGQRVILEDGREVVVLESTAAGKYTKFDLSDGTSVLDLHKKVEDGRVQLVEQTIEVGPEIPEEEESTSFDDDVVDADEVEAPDAEEWRPEYGEDYQD